LVDGRRAYTGEACMRVFVAFLCLTLTVGQEVLGQSRPVDGSMMYRCPGNNYKNTLTEAEAAAQGCVLIGDAAWQLLPRRDRAATREFKIETLERDSVGISLRTRYSGGAQRRVDGQLLLIERSLEELRIDCTRWTLSVERTYYYDAAGSLLFEGTKAAAPRKSPPDSYGEDLVSEACSRLRARRVK
jgi:hypothetical protein